MARALALILLAGAILALTAPLVPHPDEMDERAHLAIGLGALLAAGAAWFAGSRLPVIGFQALAALGTLLITASIYSTDAEVALPENLVLYLWPILYAGYFFSRRATAVQLGIIAASYATVLFALNGIGQEGLSALVTVIGTLTAAAVFVVYLRERHDRDLSLHRATIESTTDGILVVDAGGRWASFNRNFLEMWRIPPELVRARDDDAALEFVLGQLEDPAAFIAKVRELYKRPEAESFDELRFKDGRVIERYSQPQRVDGRSVGRVWSFRDVTERKRSEERLQHLADHDPLTDLYNRRRFEAELDREAARAARYQRDGAVLLMDLDDFKSVNDGHGHVWGDELLRNAGNVIKGRVRGTDILARLGGDEFAILLPEADQVRAVKLAEELLEVLRSLLVESERGEIRVTTSVGLVTLGSARDSGTEPMVAADTAMYRAKAEGRNRLAVYEPSRDGSMPAQAEGRRSRPGESTPA